MLLKTVGFPSYHHLASGALAADRHSHPLHFFAFLARILYTSIQELGPPPQRRLCKPSGGRLTRVVEHNSGAVVPVHVAAVQPSGYPGFLSPQSFCPRGTDQQPEAKRRAGRGTERARLRPQSGLTFAPRPLGRTLAVFMHKGSAQN